jgi:hypothetical protein
MRRVAAFAAWLAAVAAVPGPWAASPPGNPFGGMLPPRLMTSEAGVDVARSLGVRYIRPDAVLTASPDARCPACDRFRRAGFDLVLTLRHTSDPRVPSRPPGDLVSYRRTVGEVVARYRPALVVVENEESSAVFSSGDPEEYGTQLRVACSAAHAQGVPCANGGAGRGPRGTARVRRVPTGG